MTKWWAVGIVGVFSLATTGCYDRMELEQQAFVVALGIDQAPNHLIDYSFLLALPVSSATSAQGGQDPMAAAGPVTFRAHSVVEAMQLANSSVERSLTLSHLGLVVFGSSVAKAGLLPQLYPMVRFREFRRTTLLGVSQGSALSVLSNNKPVLERSTDRLADDISEIGRRSGLIPVVYLHDYLRNREDNQANPLLALCAVNSKIMVEKAGSSGSGGSDAGVSGSGGNGLDGGSAGGALPPQAGDMQRQAGNPVEWSGAGVFRQDRMVDRLTGHQVMDIRLLQGGLHAARFTVVDPTNPAHTVTLRLKWASEPQYKIVLSSKPAKIRVRLPLEADLISTEEKVNYTLASNQEKLTQSVSKELSAELTQLLRHLCHDDGVDVIPISRHARGQFATDAKFVQFPWAQTLRAADLSVQAEVRIHRFGIADPLGNA